MADARTDPGDPLVADASLRDNVDRAGSLDALPQTKSLDHANPFLSPSQTATFDVDAFLVSRASGATLADVAEELQHFGASLKAELDEVVDRDFRGFVNLGMALKAEGPRIARLDWKVSTADADDQEPSDGQHSRIASRDERAWQDRFDVPRDASGNLGLERVRIEIEHVRNRMREAERAVRSTLRRREAIAVERTNLQILLSFNDSLTRLESLLLPEKNAEDPTDVAQATSESSSSYWQAFEQTELDGSASSDVSDDHSTSSDEDDESDTKHRQLTAKQNTIKTSATPLRARRRTSGIAAARRRSSLGLPIDGVVASSDATQSSKLTVTLPSRVARASSEHAALLFLSDQARSLGYGEFADAQADRIGRVRDALKADLDKLIKMLTGLHGASLLVQQREEVTDNPYVIAQRAELASWSQAKASLQQRRAEQQVWLESALATWIALPQSVSEEGVQDTFEAEEAVRKALVEPWCTTHIQQSALNLDAVSTASIASTDMASGSGDILLARDVSSPGQADEKAAALIRLYNDILMFVSRQTAVISSTAENVLQARAKGTDGNAECELYVRAVWRAIATRLMEQVGGQLFFVGRPEDFRRNYTVSMAFVRAFERLAPSERALDALRRDTVYQTFRRRWQLPVYFQMRLRETVSALENALAESSGAHFGTAQRRTGTVVAALPLMSATQAVLHAFAAPWSGSSNVPELSPRQWRLSLQVISRFRNWIQDQLPADVLPAHRRVVDAATRAVGGGGALSRPTPSSPSSTADHAQRFVSSAPSAVGSPSRAGTPTMHDADAENQVVHLCTAVAADLEWLEEQARKVFDEQIAPTLLSTSYGVGVPGLPDEAVAGLRDALDAALSFHQHIVPLLAAKVTTTLKTRCAEPLRLVRSVSTQYRSAASTAPHKNSAAPAIEPSFFVVQFLRPVRHYLGKGDGTTSSPSGAALLPRSVRQVWVKEVIEDFVVRYTASLQTMSKNYESLQRLKRVNAGKAGSGDYGGGGAAADDGEADKMHAQMTVDVECLQREVGQLDVPTDTAVWERLWAAARGELVE